MMPTGVGKERFLKDYGGIYCMVNLWLSCIPDLWGKCSFSDIGKFPQVIRSKHNDEVARPYITYH